MARIQALPGQLYELVCPPQLDPTTWMVGQVGLDLPANRDIQMDLFHDYGTNVPL